MNFRDAGDAAAAHPRGQGPAARGDDGDARQGLAGGADHGESGLPQLSLAFSAGILAPAGTPAAVVAKLNAEINEAMKSPELAASMGKLGFEPKFWSPQDYAAFLAEEGKRWRRS